MWRTCCYVRFALGKDSSLEQRNSQCMKKVRARRDDAHFGSPRVRGRNPFYFDSRRVRAGERWIGGQCRFHSRYLPDFFQNRARQGQTRVRAFGGGERNDGAHVLCRAQRSGEANPNRRCERANMVGNRGSGRRREAEEPGRGFTARVLPGVRARTRWLYLCDGESQIRGRLKPRNCSIA